MKVFAPEDNWMYNIVQFLLAEDQKFENSIEFSEYVLYRMSDDIYICG